MGILCVRMELTSACLMRVTRADAAAVIIMLLELRD